MVKALSINVASNESYTNGRGLIDPVDLTFEYLPIPEEGEVETTVPTYSGIETLRGRRLKNQPVHLDPEFETYTYGHVKRFGEMKSLLNLDKGDYLFFHATLSHPSSNLWLTAVIGYFVIESVEDCRGLTSKEVKEKHRNRFKNNAHLKRTDSSVDLLISGTKGSELLEHAILLSTFSEPLKLIDSFKDNITTVTGKRINEGNPWHRWTLKIERPEDILKMENTQRKNQLRVYTMTDDTGFAPHVKDGWISLACCAGPTRKNAEKGDFVLGVAASSRGNAPQHAPIFLMQVDKKVTFDEYFNDPNFAGRVDNIYELDGGSYVQNRENVTDRRYDNFHKDGEDPQKSEFVLLSRHFYYFGDSWKEDNKLHELTKSFCSEVGFSYTAGGHSKNTSLKNGHAKKYLKHIIYNHRTGKQGKPNDPSGNKEPVKPSGCD